MRPTSSQGFFPKKEVGVQRYVHFVGVGITICLAIRYRNRIISPQITRDEENQDNKQMSAV